MNVLFSCASTSRFGWSTGPMNRISMAVNRYSVKEIGMGTVKYFTAISEVVSIRQEPIKQAKYVFMCKPPP